MLFREIIFLAIESLLANKMRAALTMLGMIIGVGSVVLLVSIGNGAKNYITQEFEGMGTNLISVQPGKSDKKGIFKGGFGGAKKKLTLLDVQALERQATTIEAVTGITFGSAAIERGGLTSNSNILGCNENFVRVLNVTVASGVFFTREEDDYARRVVVLGANVSKILFPDSAPIGQWVKINESEFRVIGVLQESGSTLGFNMDDIAFLPTRTSLRLMNDDKLMGIRIKAKSKSGIQDTVDEVTEILRRRQNNEENFTVITQVSMMQTMNTILGMLTYVLGGIAMISMLVGGIGIMNIMLVSVTERTREIGIRRAVGARKKDIMKQFLTEAITLSVLGGSVGLFGSAALTWLIYFAVPKFDMRAPWWVMVPAFLMSLVTGIFFGVFPARKAANTETIEALRYE